MNMDAIRRRVSGGGFRPFALRTSGGHEYLIKHSETVLIAPPSIGVLDRDGEIVTLDALHILAIKNLPSKEEGCFQASGRLGAPLH
jgi:hypothetical protein